MNNPSVLVGRRYGRLVVLSQDTSLPYRAFICKCDCGKEKTIRNCNLYRAKSCGCEGRRSPEYHGRTGTAEYRIWNGMRDRCYNKRSHYYVNYGGRGIKVCECWRNSFVNFFEDMGERPSSRHCIERIDNNGDYEPTNCKWTTYLEQSNNRRSNHLLTFNGETLPMKALWRKYAPPHLNWKTFLGRIWNGWKTEDALLKPLIPNGCRKCAKHSKPKYV